MRECSVELLEQLLQIEPPVVTAALGGVMILVPAALIGKELPNLKEVRKVVSKLKDGKAASPSDVPVDLLKSCG